MAEQPAARAGQYEVLGSGTPFSGVSFPPLHGPDPWAHHP